MTIAQGNAILASDVVALAAGSHPSATKIQSASLLGPDTVLSGSGKGVLYVYINSSSVTCFDIVIDGVKICDNCTLYGASQDGAVSTIPLPFNSSFSITNTSTSFYGKYVAATAVYY